MHGDNYFLTTSLPSLGELGSSPPISLVDLLEKLKINPRASRLVAAVVLPDDLIQWQALAAGEITEPAPAVLSAAQIRNEAPLPDFLGVAEPGLTGRAVLADGVWSGYYRYAFDLAGRLASKFLTDWTVLDVSLKNALAQARSAALGLDSRRYIVLPELSHDLKEFDELIITWSAAPDPLAGLKVVDAYRWDWLKRHDGYYTFSDDELAAYSARLMLLHRWSRLTQARQAREHLTN